MGCRNDVPAGYLRGLDEWRPLDTSTGEGGDVAEKQVMQWRHDEAVPWAITLRQRQFDVRTADIFEFPANFDAVAYDGGTCRARIEFDDSETGHGRASFSVDFGSQQQVIVPPTRQVQVYCGVATGFVTENGSFPGGLTTNLRAFEVVAYARALGKDYAPPPRREVVLTDWVQIAAEDEFVRRLPRCATDVSWGFRNATNGAAAQPVVLSFDYNDQVPTPLGSGPLIDAENESFRIPVASSRARFENDEVGVPKLGAITWRIQP